MSIAIPTKNQWTNLYVINDLKKIDCDFFYHSLSLFFCGCHGLFGQTSTNVKKLNNKKLWQKLLNLFGTYRHSPGIEQLPCSSLQPRLHIAIKEMRNFCNHTIEYQQQQLILKFVFIFISECDELISPHFAPVEGFWFLYLGCCCYCLCLACFFVVAPLQRSFTNLFHN